MWPRRALIGGSFPTHKTAMAFSGERTPKDGANELVVKFESPDLGGVKLVKTYTIKRGAYDIGRPARMLNTGTARSRRSCTCSWCATATSPGRVVVLFHVHRPGGYTEAKKFQKVEFSDIERTKAEFEKSSTNGYVAMVQHYFASAWILPDGLKRDLFMRKVDNNLYSTGMITPLDRHSPGASQSGGRHAVHCRPAGRKKKKKLARP